MKVTLDKLTFFNNKGKINITNPAEKSKEHRYPAINDIPDTGLSLANFPNVSFGAKNEGQTLLKCVNTFKCAYSGKPMISQNELAKVFTKLIMSPDTDSAIKILRGYTKYMYDVESKVFEILEKEEGRNKKDFSAILSEYAPESLKRLRIKQRKVLGEIRPYIEKLCNGKEAGDVDLDGNVTAVDASKVLNYYAQESVNSEVSVVTEAQMQYMADINSDGIVDSVDAAAILSTYAKNSVQG